MAIQNMSTSPARNATAKPGKITPATEHASTVTAAKHAAAPQKTGGAVRGFDASVKPGKLKI